MKPSIIFIYIYSRTFVRILTLSVVAKSMDRDFQKVLTLWRHSGTNVRGVRAHARAPTHIYILTTSGTDIHMS